MGKFTKAKVYHHSCGAITGIMDDLREIGIEILNPVQITAEGMQSDQLKKRFGDKFTFWGAIDTFEVLPNGTPADVAREVQRVIGDLAPGGGYVLGSIHNIQFDVTAENIDAMFTSAKACII